MIHFKTLFQSKKRNILFAIFAILSTFFIAAFQYQPKALVTIPAQKTAYKNIIFDLGDVLFTTSKSAQSSTVTPVVFSNLSLLFKIPGMDIKKELFTLLNTIPAQTTFPMYNKGKKLPQIMVDWMTGRSIKEIRAIVSTHIEESNYSKDIQRLFKAITLNLMSNPQKFADSQQPIKSMIKLVESLKKQGYRIYVLSNWDKESFALLKARFPDIFNLFDGIMISGEEKMGKPQPEFYVHLLNHFHLSTKESIFIDDEKFNINGAKTIGIKAIQYKKIAPLCKDLINLGVLIPA